MKEHQIKSILQRYVGRHEKITEDRRIEHILRFSNTPKPFALSEFIKHLGTIIDISKLPHREYKTVGEMCTHIANWKGNNK